MSLEDATDEELAAEIARRQRLKEGGPAELPTPDWSKVHGTVREGVHGAIRDGYKNEDLRTYIYEAAMEAVYGPDFWKWWNRIP